MAGIPAGREARPVAGSAKRYERRRPDETLLYQIIEQHYPVFSALMAEQGRELPAYVRREFEDFLKCGRLEHGFLRLRCERYHDKKRVAFSCKRRGFCPSCGARRMVESAALLVDKLLSEQPMRQWVLSVPFAIRFLFAARPFDLELGGLLFQDSDHVLCHVSKLGTAEQQPCAELLVWQRVRTNSRVEDLRPLLGR